MNRICLVSLLFISMHVAGQSGNTVRLLFRTGSCRPTSFLDPYSPDTIRIFRQPENQLIATVVPRQQRKSPFQATVPKADYRIIYRNTYGQTVEKNLHLYDDTLTELVLCPDSLLSYTENTLAKLKNKENLTIAYNSSGCFHNINEKIILTRVNTRIAVRLYGDSTEYYLKGDSVHSRLRRNVLLKSKALTPEDSLVFIGFENELRLAHRGRCTTLDQYSINSKYWNAQIQDGSCRWGGYFRLKIAWFGPQDQDTAEFLSSNWPGFNTFAHDH